MGLLFTWCNRRFNGSVVWVRLDSVMATADWILKFPFAHLHHLLGSSSDHKSLWLVLNDVHAWFYRAQKPFQFEAMWFKDDRCKGVVHSAWDMCSDGDPVSKVMRKVSGSNLTKTVG